MINQFNFTEKEAIESFNKFIKEFNLTKIVRNSSTDATFEQLIKESNDRVIKKYKREGLRIGTPDVIIIGGFLREKINSLHTGDEGFQKTCEELKINIIPLPKRDIDKERELKKLMKKRDKV